MDERRPLTADERSAWKPLAALIELLPARLDSALQRVVGQPSIALYALEHLRRSATRSAGVSELAACTSSPLPRTSRLVTRLEADGLVERTTSAADGRAVVVRLTDAGAAFLDRAMPQHDRIVRELVLDPLAPDQLGQLAEIARALCARLHPDVDAPTDRQRTPAPSRS